MSSRLREEDKKQEIVCRQRGMGIGCLRGEC